VGGQTLDSSFRDPSGFLYTRDGTLYRQVNQVFREPFEAFVASGLCEDLIRNRVLVAHRPVGLELAATADACAVLEPQRIGFVSYPYEWCFGQLRDAALLTLELQERVLARGFTLRDASAYNVQFEDGRPIFIDTLSFEPRQEGAPWAAYKQFCEHFLVPLALMSRRDIRCGSLLRSHLDGIPLQLGSRLLPRSTWLRPGTLVHLHLHAWLVERYAGTGAGTSGRRRGMSRDAAIALVRGLRGTIEGLAWAPAGTQWADYVGDNNYTADAARSKHDIVVDLLRDRGTGVAWDLGANTGEYSRAAREVVPRVIAFDLDPAAVERNYRRVRQQGETGILPLLLDLTDPSPAQGWAHRERLSLEQRGPADAVLALALVHHLAIGHNLPLERIARFLSRLGRTLVIEFVPKSDSQVQRLLRSRPDIFPGYTREAFEEAFKRHFRIDRSQEIAQSQRSMYLMTSCPPESSG
jgi:ribosomal protein L11 methylase PrmA